MERFVQIGCQKLNLQIYVPLLLNPVLSPITPERWCGQWYLVCSEHKIWTSE